METNENYTMVNISTPLHINKMTHWLLIIYTFNAVFRCLLLGIRNMCIYYDYASLILFNYFEHANNLKAKNIVWFLFSYGNS